MRVSSLWVWLLLASRAWAEPDLFLFGDGHRGPLAVTSNVRVNRVASISADAPDNADFIVVDRSFADTTDLIMVWHLRGLLPPADGGLIDLSATPVGSFELARASAGA